MTDRIAAAIEATAAPTPQKRYAARIELVTGRSVGIEVPLDMTAVELVDFIAKLTTGLPPALAKATQAPLEVVRPRSGILVPARG